MTVDSSVFGSAEELIFMFASRCEGGDHPGPNVGTGRGAPEIDIIEACVFLFPLTTVLLNSAC